MNSATATITPRPDVRSRRNTELALLVFAILIPSAAYANIGLATEGTIPAGTWGHIAGLALLAVVAHLAVRRFATYADPVILPVAVLLNGLGLVTIYRADQVLDVNEPRAFNQFMWSALGIALLVGVIVLLKDHRMLQKYTYTAMAAGLVLLALPIFFPEVNGAKLWITLGAFRFQPGELAKILLIFFFAGYLVVKRDALALAGRRILGVDLPRGRDLGPILVAWGLGLAIMVAEKDLGTSLLFYGTFVTLLYISTERISWIILGGGLFLSGAYFGYLLFSHVQQRVDSWLDPFLDPTNRTYHVLHGLIGLASGGVTGSGLGQGYLRDILEGKTDYILVVFGEENGLAGIMAVLLLYAIFVQRGLRTALACRDAYGKLLAAGFAVIITLQIFVIVGGVTRLIPLTGLTTPFMSAGGSSLLANYAIVGLLLKISDHARRPLTPGGGQISPEDEKTQVVKV